MTTDNVTTISAASAPPKPKARRTPSTPEEYRKRVSSFLSIALDDLRDARRLLSVANAALDSRFNDCHDDVQKVIDLHVDRVLGHVEESIKEAHGDDAEAGS